MINKQYKNIIEKFKITKTSNIIYGTNIPMPNLILPTPWKTYIKFDQTYNYFFLFDEIGITLFLIDGTDYVTIKWDQVESFKVSHIAIIGKVTIKTKENTYKFQLNRFVFGCPWIKENTKYLEENNYFNPKNK